VLILAALPDWASKSTQPADAPAVPSELLQAIYIVSREPFDEVEEFVAKSAKEYHLELRRYEQNMRPALEAYLADKPNVKAVFMGTRRTDPHCENLTHFKPTDKDWPQFMRINPVIDWHYADIWTVSRRLCCGASIWPSQHFPY
jgi:FAD synthetase